MSDSLKDHVQKITKLPTLPVIAQEVLSLTNSDNVSIGKLESIIENDPAISAKVLSIANSAFFGFKQPAKTLNAAIARIGLDNLSHIAVGVSIMTVLEGKKMPKMIDYQKTFNHSVTVGFISRLLAKNLKVNLEEIMINGLLHDIGYLVLSRYYPEKYIKVVEMVQSSTPLIEAEKEVFDFCHTNIGSWLAEKWQLSRVVQDTTRYHHNPTMATRNQKHVAVIHIADYLTTKKISSVFTKDPQYPFDPSSLEILEMTESDLEEFEAEIVRQ